MIAINWFEVFLPTDNLCVYASNLTPGEQPPKPKSSLTYQTILRREEMKIYHLTDSQPENTFLEELDHKKYPSIVATCIEYGFALRLVEEAFIVILDRVGGKGLAGVNQSLKPDIYLTLEGIKFRCFYGFDWQQPYRWGLILSYISGQRFVISLKDQRLRDFAMGKHIVPIETDEEISGVLENVVEGFGILRRRKGDREKINLEEWTLPCNKQNLIGFLTYLNGSPFANEVSTKLQQDALTLTKEKRINTSLAKDQLDRLTHIMQRHNLFDFQLHLAEPQSAKISQKPLIIGN